MTLLTTDPFNNLLNPFVTGTSGATIVATNPRNGNCAQQTIATGFITYTFTVSKSDTVTVGLGWRVNSLSQALAVFSLWGDAGVTQHVTVTVTTAGALEVRRGTNVGTVLATSSTGLIVVNTWYYLELQVKLHDTTGTYELRRNGVAVIGPTGGADTRNAGTDANFDTLRLESKVGTAAVWYDDLYLKVGAGETFTGPIDLPNTLPLVDPMDSLVKWTGPSGWTINASGGQVGGYLSSVGTNALIYDIDVAVRPNRMKATFWYRTPATISTQRLICQLRGPTGGVNLATLSIESNASLACRRGGSAGTIVGQTAAGAIVPNTWYRMIVEESISATAGVLNGWLDGVQFANSVGDTTQGTSDTVFAQFVFNGTNANVDELLLEISGLEVRVASEQLRALVTPTPGPATMAALHVRTLAFIGAPVVNMSQLHLRALGPPPTPVTTSSGVRYWDGVQWVDAVDVRLWDGVQWVGAGEEEPVGVSGAVSVVLAPFTASATGTVTNPGVAGSVAATLAPFTVSATGMVTTASGSTLTPVPWHGGPEYWTVTGTGAMMAKAEAKGWSDPDFFPIGIWWQKQEDFGTFVSAGINLAVLINHDPGLDLTTMCTEHPSVSYLAQWESGDGSGWTEAEIANSPCVVGHVVMDEIDMFSDDPDDPLSQQTTIVNELRSRNDGRFLYSNYGKGSLGTFWNTEDMPALVDQNDVFSDDIYWWTDPYMDAADNALDMLPSETVRASQNYGWTVDQMFGFMNPSHRQPVWCFVEVGHPFHNTDGDGSSLTITPDQLEGAVWNCIVAGATGVLYFNHSFGGACESFNVLGECGAPMLTRVTNVNMRINALASTLNTQSYEWDPGAGSNVRTMVKFIGDHHVVFAVIAMNTSPGSRTFAVPATSGTATVVGESRTVTITSGHITDTFAAAYTMHVYQLPATVAPSYVHTWAGAAPATISFGSASHIATRATLSGAVQVHGARIWSGGVVSMTPRYVTLWDVVEGVSTTIIHQETLPAVLTAGWHDYLFTTPQSVSLASGHHLAMSVTFPATAGTSDWGMVGTPFPYTTPDGVFTVINGGFSSDVTGTVLPPISTDFGGVDFLYSLV